MEPSLGINFINVLCTANKTGNWLPFTGPWYVFDLKAYIFDLKEKVFHLKTYVFHLKTYVFDLKKYIYDLLLSFAAITNFQLQCDIFDTFKNIGTGLYFEFCETIKH